METQKQWYIVCARPGYEKKVAAALEKKRMETYCPIYKIQGQKMDRKKIIYKPLFPCYVFVHVSVAQHQNMMQTDGFVNFVYWLNKPAVIDTEEIETIKAFLREYDHISIEKTEVLPHDKVRIINGPLVFWEGNVVEVSTTTIKIALPSLGYCLMAEISNDTDPVSKTYSQYAR